MLPETQIKLIQEKGDMLSMEAVTSNEGFASALSQLPELLSDVRSLFSSLTITQLGKFSFYGSPLDKTATKMAKADYLDFSAVTLPVPEGLIVPYAEYGQKLLTASEHIAKIDGLVLRPFQAWLGRGIGSPSALASVSSTLGVDFRKEEAILARLERDLVACFVTKGTRASDVPYTTAIRNQSDWRIIQTQIRAMEAIYSKEFEKEMRERLTAIDVLLSTLIQRVEEKRQGYDLSPKTLTELANASAMIAREFEYYSIARYRVDSYIRAIDGATEKLKNF